MSNEPGINPPADASPLARDAGTRRMETILRDIACPCCEYNLRGLPGPIVRCPECGEACDVPRMIAARWEGPWWSAPRFNTLMLPTAWALVGLFIISLALSFAHSPVGLIVLAIVILGVIGVWGFLLWQADRLFANGRGVALAMLGHVILVGYVVGFFGTAICAIILIMRVVGLVETRDWMLLINITFAGVFSLIFATVVWMSRRAEKYIAQCCIRRYMERMGATG